MSQWNESQKLCFHLTVSNFNPYYLVFDRSVFFILLLLLLLFIIIIVTSFITPSSYFCIAYPVNHDHGILRVPFDLKNSYLRQQSASAQQKIIFFRKRNEIL